MLFTDIEGSSDGVRTLGTDKWEAILERHNRIIRDAINGHGGFEVRSEGDAFFVVFTSPNAALTAAAEIQGGLSATDWPPQAVSTCASGRLPRRCAYCTAVRPTRRSLESRPL